MPRKNFENIGELQDYECLQGVITDTPDATTDTCTVRVAGNDYSDTPIFYHCSDDAVERENGAIEGAAAGFAQDDPVVVLKQLSGTEILVVGHLDGIRACRAGGVMLVQLWDLTAADWKYLFYDLIETQVYEVSDTDGSIISQPFLLSDVAASSISEIETRNSLDAATAATKPSVSFHTVDNGYVNIQGGYNPTTGLWEYPWERLQTWPIHIWTALKSIEFDATENKYTPSAGADTTRTFVKIGCPTNAGWDDFIYREKAIRLSSDDWDALEDLIKFTVGSGSTPDEAYSSSVYLHPYLSAADDELNNVWSYTNGTFAYPLYPPTDIYPGWGDTITNGNLWYQGKHALLMDGYSCFVTNYDTGAMEDADTTCYFYFQERETTEDKFSKANFSQPVTDEQLYVLFGTTKAAHLALKDSFMPAAYDYQTFDHFGIRASKLYYSE